jgi:hypothetical protein
VQSARVGTCALAVIALAFAKYAADSVKIVA